MLWGEMASKADRATLKTIDYRKLAEAIVRNEERLVNGMGNCELRDCCREFKKVFSLKLGDSRDYVFKDSPLTRKKNPNSKGWSYFLERPCPHEISILWKSRLLDAGFIPNWAYGLDDEILAGKGFTTEY